ncbi:MAG: YcaO-like family protein, partial [Campylobacterota bacterium]|nr:YcaO-like family protein [Campylobacterota bacterium]
MSKKTYIKGKDSDLEGSIKSMQSKLHTLGFQVKEGTWLNPVAYVYSVLIEHTSCPCIFTNGKGSCEKSCRASALGEFFERMSSNYFFADYYLGKEVTDSSFVHYPSERWFDGGESTLPEGLLNEKLWQYYNPEDELHADQLFDLNSGAGEKGI